MKSTEIYTPNICAHEMPRAKIRSAKGSNFKEDDSALFVFLMYKFMCLIMKGHAYGKVPWW